MTAIRQTLYAKLTVRRVRAAILLGVLLTLAAPTLATPSDPSEPIILVADRMLDGVGGIKKSVRILVEDGIIKSIDAPKSSSTRTIDLRGKLILPGFIDTHVHIFYHFRNGRFVDNRLVGLDEPRAEMVLRAAENANLALDAGFTTIQVAGPGHPEDIFLREALQRGILPGPRLLTSLQWLRFEAGKAPPPDGLRAIVRERKGQGADFIKVFASSSERDGMKPLLSQEQLDAICGEARAQGLRVMVHAYTLAVDRALRAGCTTIEHGTQGMTKAVIEEFARRGAYYNPTLYLADKNYLDNKDKFLGVGNFNEEAFKLIETNVLRAPSEFIQVLKNGRVNVVFGSDASAGAHGRNAEELIYRIQVAGMDPMRAVISATSLAARSVGLGTQIGTIAPGFRADIIAVDGDILRDATAARRVSFVMSNGRIIRDGGLPKAYMEARPPPIEASTTSEP